jgi:hypothetical protein
MRNRSPGRRRADRCARQRRLHRCPALGAPRRRGQGRAAGPALRLGLGPIARRPPVRRRAGLAGGALPPAGSGGASAPAAVEVGPRAASAGRATRYGEVVLDACVAPSGGAEGHAGFHPLPVRLQGRGLVASGHLERGYLAQELVRAGGVHVPDAMSPAAAGAPGRARPGLGRGAPWGPDPERARTRSPSTGAPAAVSPWRRRSRGPDGWTSWSGTSPVPRSGLPGAGVGCMG